MGEHGEGGGDEGPEDEKEGWLFETANVTAMSSTHSWVLQRKAHVVAVQEHAVPARKAQMYKAMAGAQRRSMELGPAVGDATAPQAGTGFVAKREAKLVHVALEGTELQQYYQAG